MSTDQALETAYLLDRLERLTRAGEATGDLNPAQWEAMRFMARANRFSRTPAALAEYLGSTRGTVSQTLIALQHKGHVTKRKSRNDRRSVTIDLTDTGRAALDRDPLLTLAGELAAVAPDRLGAFGDVLRQIVQARVRSNGGRPFGQCSDCRHFRRHDGASPGHPFRCALLDEPLSLDDSTAICAEQDPAVPPPPTAASSVSSPG